MSRLVMTLQKSVVAFFSLLPALIFGSAVKEANPQPQTQPLLPPALAYELTDPNGKTHYLVGTIHARRPDDSSLPDFITRLLNQVDVVCVEVQVEEATAAQLFSLVQRYAVQRGEKSLRELLGEEDTKRLTERINRLGGSFTEVQGFQPWFVEMILTNRILQEVGLTSQTGVDVLLIRETKQLQKKVVGLETLSEQFESLASLSLEAQLRSLKKGLSQWDFDKQKLLDIISAYQRRDAALILKIIQESFDKDSEFFLKLLEERNNRLFQRFLNETRTSTSVLVAVGAAHLLGDYSLARLAQNLGWKVRALP